MTAHIARDQRDSGADSMTATCRSMQVDQPGGMAHQMHQRRPLAEIVDEFAATLDFSYSH